MDKNYHINIFRPKTPYAKSNAILIFTAILIWAFAVFGFQILLKVTEKPVPEKSYIEFSYAWEKLQQDTHTNADLQIMTKTISGVMAKSSEARQNLILQKFIANPQTSFSQKQLAQIPVLMKKYLVHNQSFLTDTKFLGFPFHYFYTAVFLLILFVLICFTYCLMLEKINKKYQVEID
jgi:putative solute:sodium symporter small subunit